MNPNRNISIHCFTIDYSIYSTRLLFSNFYTNLYSTFYLRLFNCYNKHHDIYFHEEEKLHQFSLKSPLRKTVSEFFRRYYDLISKSQVGLKSLLRQGLSEPEIYGDLVYKLKKIVGSNDFSAQFIKNYFPL